MWDIVEEFLKGLVILLATVLIICWPTMLLWNYLMPYLFGLPTISFGQAGCIIILAYLIFNV